MKSTITRAVVALVLGASATLLTAAAPDTDASPPVLPMAGTVTIEAPSGLSALRLAVPDIGEPIRQDNELTTVDESYEGDFALVQTALPIDEDSICEDARFCRLQAIEVVPDWHRPEDLPDNNGLRQPRNSCIEDRGDGVRRPCPITTDVLEVYIAADAPLTFTLHFPALAGSVTHAPNGTFTGVLEQIPVTDCPTGDCDRLAIGSSARTMGTPDSNASVRAFVYARSDQRTLADGVRASNAASIGAEGCTYPSMLVPSGSTDPDDHPLGCEFAPTVSDGGGVEWDTGFRSTYVAPGAEAVGVSVWWNHLDGSERGYVGFNVRNESLIPDYVGAHNAWVVWLEQGID